MYYPENPYVYEGLLVYLDFEGKDIVIELV